MCVLGKNLSDLSYPSDGEEDSSKYAISIKQLLRLKEQPGICIIDVRTAKEHQVENYGGKSIPLAELRDRLDELDKRQTIILYCASGKRSLKALYLLRESGFRQVKYVTPIEDLASP